MTRGFFQRAGIGQWCRLLACILVLFAWAGTAQGQLTTSPIILEIKAYPGGMETQTLVVHNTGKQPMRCTIQLAALDVRDTGLPVAVENSARNCKDWLTIKPDSFRLQAGEGEKILCQIRPPKKVLGGYYAMLICNGTPEDTTPDDAQGARLRSGVHFSYRNMVPLLLTIQGGKLDARILAGKPVFAEENNQQGFLYQAPVFNAGNIHIKVGGVLDVKGEGGQTLKTVALSTAPSTILPDHARVFTGKERLALPDGLYQAEVRLDVGKVTQAIKQDFSFYIDKGKPSLATITDDTRSKISKQSAGFIIAPQNFQEEVVSGGRRSLSVELTNIGQETIPVKATVMEWVRTPEGRDQPCAQTPNAARSGRGAILLQQPAFQLRPQGKQRVPILLGLPRGITGEYYAAVTFDRTDQKLDSSPDELARRSVFVAVQAKGTGTAAAAIEKFAATRMPSGAIRFAIQVKNTGNMGFVPETAIQIQNARGENLGRLPSIANAFMIQAGASGVLGSEWNQVLEPGKYTANLELRFSPNLPPVTANANFEVPGVQSTPAASDKKIAATGIESSKP